MGNDTDTNDRSKNKNTETVFDTDNDARELRLEEHPSGWVKLTQDTELVLLIDAILDSPPEDKFSRNVIQNQTGISGDVLTEKMNVIADLGVITFCSEDEDEWYKVTSTMESDMLKAVTRVNSIMNAYYSDEETQ